MDKKMRELCEWVLKTAKKAGAKDCRVSLGRRRFAEVSYRDGSPEAIKQASTQELAIQLFVDGRFSAQNTSDLRKPAIEDFLKEAVSTTRLLAEDPMRTLPEPKYYEGRAKADLKITDAGFERVKPEDKHAYVKAMGEAAKEAGGDKVVSISADWGDDWSEALTLTSNGFSGEATGTSFSGSAAVTVSDSDGRRPNAYDYASCRMRVAMPDAKTIGVNAARRALASLGAKKIDTATLPIIIENRVVGQVLDGLFEAIGGRFIYQKRSFLADKRGQKFGDEKLTIIDDPLVVEGLGSSLFDGDGIAAKKRTIVDAGVLKEFFIDWYYSRKLGCEPTTGGTSNIMMPAGKRSIGEIMKELGKGILITNFLGGNSNSATGDFSIGIFGQLFDKGEIVHPVSEMNIADNYLKFWNKLAECASDPWRYSSWQTPSIVLTDVVVAGT